MKRSLENGFTFIEALITAVLTAIFLAGTLSLEQHSLSLLGALKRPTPRPSCREYSGTRDQIAFICSGNQDESVFLVN